MDNTSTGAEYSHAVFRFPLYYAKKRKIQRLQSSLEAVGKVTRCYLELEGLYCFNVRARVVDKKVLVPAPSRYVARVVFGFEDGTKIPFHVDNTLKNIVNDIKKAGDCLCDRSFEKSFTVENVYGTNYVVIEANLVQP